MPEKEVFSLPKYTCFPSLTFALSSYLISGPSPLIVFFRPAVFHCVRLVNFLLLLAVHGLAA